jgi:NDP-sugar pyrophosphorylase family protein
MGTAGALKLAQPYLQDDAVFLVMNGDSFVEADLPRLIEFHRQHGCLVSMAVIQVENAARYGTVQMDADGRVIGFAEKTGRDVPGVVNAGIYIFDRSVLEFIPEGPASLERDVFPQVLAHGVYAMEQKGMFIDIGTPEDYARAQGLSNKLYETALQKQECPGAEGA